MLVGCCCCNCCVLCSVWCDLRVSCVGVLCGLVSICYSCLVNDSTWSCEYACVVVRFRVCCIHVSVVRVWVAMLLCVCLCVRACVVLCLYAFLCVGVFVCLCVFLCVARVCV